MVIFIWTTFLAFFLCLLFLYSSLYTMPASMRALFACTSGRKTLILLGLVRSFVARQHWKNFHNTGKDERLNILLMYSLGFLINSQLKTVFLCRVRSSRACDSNCISRSRKPKLCDNSPSFPPPRYQHRKHKNCHRAISLFASFLFYNERAFLWSLCCGISDRNF